MKTTKLKVNVLTKLLAGVKLNKIEDKKVKVNLLKNYLNLHKVSNEFEKDRATIAQKFQEDWDTVILEVEALRKENKPITNEYWEYLEAEKDANKLIKELSEEEVTVEIIPVSVDNFIKDIEDDITLDTVSFLVENGILE